MNAEVRDERFREVAGDQLEMEQIASGFIFTEGPVWHPVERHLTFSDIPGDKMYRWAPAGDGGRGALSLYRQPTRMANGNTYDRQGRMLSCEHNTSRVVREEADGSLTVLASHYQGRQLNSPNDIVVKSDGRIYFTDPAAGRSERYGRFRPQELDFQGFFRVDPDGGNLTLLGGDFIVPNGLCFSRGEDRLFVNDTRRRHIRVFGVQPGGLVSGGAVWAETTGEGEGIPDGMKVDSGDNLYCTGPGGIHVFGPDAACLGVIRTPERAANFTWGGGGMRDLFITATTSVYRTRVKVPGLELF